VAPAHLHGALERFAQFFVAPLCKQSAMEREVCAVDSEFSGVLQDDHSRLCQLMCHTVGWELGLGLGVGGWVGGGSGLLT